MIYLEMNGRLGNQLFRYAFARSLSIKFKEPICINIGNLGRNAEGMFLADILHFNIEYHTIQQNKRMMIWQNGTVLQKALALYYKHKIAGLENDFSARYQIEQAYAELLENHGVYWFHIGEVNYRYDNTSKNHFVIGCYEDPALFDDCRDILIKELTPKKEPSLRNEEMYRIIENTESVCISIRRGDFVTDSKNENIYNLCDIAYFKSAIDAIKNKLKNPYFIVFSDDIEWVKQHLQISGNCIYESGQDAVYEKLRLMYSCKHFILSNSTFSWWAQYLSRNKEKLVVAPSRWYKNDFESKLLDSQWIKIKV